MVRRPSPLHAAFPVLVCDAELQAASDAWIGSRYLPKRPENPQDVVVLGDTGCRMVYWQIQPCRSGVGWPFSAVAVSAASKIQSNRSQSIVIHVGDFHYRENPCADRSPECGGSPYGDNWATWEEEFFKPASPLLLAAPWVIVRGNHENCARAGAGWLFFFALPGPTDDHACRPEVPSYSLAIGKAGEQARVLVVLDTADADNRFNIEARCDAYRQWINDIDDAKSVIWLALHQPLLSRSPDGRRIDTARDNDHCKQDETTVALNVIRARLLSPAPARKVKLLLSGDLHVFQYFQPTDHNNPVQIVAGIGGTKLDKLNKLVPASSNADTKPQDADGAPQWDTDVTSFGVIGATLSVAKHGFVTMHNDGQSWTVTMLGVDGQKIASCRFSEASNASRPPTAQPDCDDNPIATHR